MAYPSTAQRRRALDVAYAVVAGAICHLAFAAAVAAIAVVGWSGMTLGQGRLPQPWGWFADAALLAQFPLLHSWLLGRGGGRVMGRLAPPRLGRTLATTTYATLAAAQTLALYLLWTPSGVTWARAQGPAVVFVAVADAAAWGLLAKAVLDAGASLQTGALGWWAVARNRAPTYPPMPASGLFARIRQPIYLGFALTQWTVPTWTPDQLAVAITLTGYCLLGPRLKERRFAARYGEAFAAYRARTPYMLPLRPGAMRRRDGGAAREPLA